MASPGIRYALTAPDVRPARGSASARPAQRTSPCLVSALTGTRVPDRRGSSGARHATRRAAVVDMAAARSVVRRGPDAAHVDLDELLAAQGGVVTRAQALAAGVGERQLRPGPGRRLVRVRGGVYADAARLSAADAAARHVVAAAAASLVSAVDLVAVGPTAAVLHGLPLLGPPPARLHLAERKDDRPLHHGASTSFRPEEVVQCGAVLVTTLARTAVDVARGRGFLAGVVAADAVLSRGTARQALLDVLNGRERWPGARAARLAAEFADPRSESPLESVGRARCHEHGLPAPELQVWLGDADGPVARVDKYWAEHRTVAEADGALKYATAADLFAEKRREDRLREAGYEVVRYTWDEALRRPELVVARVLRAFDRAGCRQAA